MTDHLDDATLDAIEARAGAATEGPWEVVGVANSIVSHPGGPIVATFGSYDPITTAEFIAHARTDVPALVAEVRRLRMVMRSLGGEP